MKKSMLHFLFVIICCEARAQSLPGNTHKKPFNKRRNTLTVNGAAGAVNFIGFSGGLEYERFITPDGSLSATIAGITYSAGTIAFGEFKVGETRTHVSGFHAIPGLRYHPLKNNHRTDFHLGLSAALGVANREDEYQENRWELAKKLADRELFAAILGQFGFNLRTSKGFVFGAYITGGPIISDARRSMDKAEENGNLYFQVGLRMGGRW